MSLDDLKAAVHRLALNAGDASGNADRAEWQIKNNVDLVTVANSTSRCIEQAISIVIAGQVVLKMLKDLEKGGAA
jgi:hypothetical protein